MTTPKYDAQKYQQFRPTYPKALFDFILSKVKHFDRAWDCGCGTGQATLAIAGSFKEIIATDISDTQIETANSHANVTYQQAPAEHTMIESQSVDLITVAQAMHWFDHEAFFKEVERVLKPGGVLAAWCYTPVDVNPQVSAIIHRLIHETFKDYWAPGREYVDDSYKTIPFPKPYIHNEDFYCEKAFHYDDLIGMLESWSPRLKYLQEHGRDVLDDVKDELQQAWGDLDEVKQGRFPIHLLIHATAD